MIFFILFYKTDALELLFFFTNYLTGQKQVKGKIKVFNNFLIYKFNVSVSKNSKPMSE